MSDGPVVITTRDIYEMLVDVKAVVDAMAPLPEKVTDHEDRIRDIENREDLSRRVNQLEVSIQDLQRRVWALPSISAVIAGAALVLTLVRTY